MQHHHPVPSPDLCPLRDTQTIVTPQIATLWRGDNAELQPPDACNLGRLRSDCTDVHGQIPFVYQAANTQLFGLGGFATTGETPDGRTTNSGLCGQNNAPDISGPAGAGAVDRGTPGAAGGTGPDYGAAAADAEPVGSHRPLAPPPALIDEPDDDEPEIEPEPVTEEYLMYLDWRREQDAS